MLELHIPVLDDRLGLTVQVYRSVWCDLHLEANARIDPILQCYPWRQELRTEPPYVRITLEIMHCC